MSSQLLTVSEFANICHATPRTIRWYQQLGLLEPVKVDEWNKYTYFSPEQAMIVFRIKLLQGLGISLKKIRNNKPEQSLSQEINQLEKILKEKQKEIKYLKKLNVLLYKTPAGELLKEENINCFSLLSLTIKNGAYHKIGNYLEKLRIIAKTERLSFSQAATFYLDSNLTYKPKNSPLKVGLILNSNKNSNKFIYKCEKFNKTKALVFNFNAPSLYLHDIYLPLVYKKLDKYISQKKIKINDHVFEIYDKRLSKGKIIGQVTTKICYPID